MLINIHMGPNEDQGERFDTLISPSGGVATLLKIQEDLGLTDVVGIDEGYPSENESKAEVRRLINNDLSQGRVPTLFFSVLIYNAERTIDYIHSLKGAYGNDIRVVVGGQLVPFAEQAYLNNPDIDSVCIGDAEVILPKLIEDIQHEDKDEGVVERRYEGWVKDSRQHEFAGVSYKNFWKIKERLAAQKEATARFDKSGNMVEEGFSQVTIQGAGGPGCSWAANNPNGACFFCALQNITLMNETPLRTLLENESEVVKELGVDRFFDVANLFLPFLRREQNKAWLQEYKRIRDELGLISKKYVYLTVGSVDDEIAQLLKEVGVVEVYIGIDHFDKRALKEENKQSKSESEVYKTLDALTRQGISFRAGIVLGSAREDENSLHEIKEGVKQLLERYPEHIRALGVFPVEIIPGSAVFEDMRTRGWGAAIFKKFEQYGFLSREDQRSLTREYVERKSNMSFDEIIGIEAEMAQLMKEKGKFEYMVDRKAESELVRYTSGERLQ